MDAELAPFHFAAKWPSNINALQVDMQQATAFAVSKACDTLLVVRTAVRVDAAMVVRDAARLVSVTAAVVMVVCEILVQEVGLLGVGNGREL
eukprot:scaffold30518_cov44-Cyclotella_meneghiniana.AAC.1